jgi:hypothetical protein
VDPEVVELRVPHDLVGGVYAHALSAWSTEHEFTLDYAVAEREPAEEPSPLRVVARIRVPVTMLFEMLRELNETLTEHEQRYGEIRGAGPEVA